MTKLFNDSYQDIPIQIEVNPRRRQMNAYQKREVGYSLEVILRKGKVMDVIGLAVSASMYGRKRRLSKKLLNSKRIVLDGSASLTKV